ncbi:MULTISPECIES: hypothetical protein [unclassified Colwellia]|uniref:hypothetical protein n=1 Tax=unclassified Colwellia TaxID=196834 RepID=UPI0015F5EC60|nr:MULTISPECIES: hypothetical protein [unclassified Colwellia]MBA6232975.1 hypothetical protein [Colwellia sp. MB02u-7]MBA6235964.1 hypothetical protein [Colwellia sp. MB02u-11]MBA6297931.1 hypothetical protein [Colwellia sp. MB3u-22]MBA6309237.1 hypothetical protein [Colwellia sp. MB3u-64]
MEEVLNELSRPIWWVSVVIAGIIINLLSAYTKPALDKVFSKYSKSIKSRNLKKNQELELYISKLEADKDFLNQELFSELRLRSQAIYLLLMGVFIIVPLNMFDIPQLFLIVFLAISAFSFFSSFSAFWAAAKKAANISSVTKT